MRIGVRSLAKKTAAFDLIEMVQVYGAPAMVVWGYLMYHWVGSTTQYTVTVADNSWKAVRCVSP
jgi:hypothetical protein